MVYYRRRRTFRRRPSYRRTFRRRATYRRRFAGKRRSAFRRKARWYSRKYNYKEKFFVEAVQLQGSHLGLISKGWNLQATQIPGFTTRKAPYDQYKIYGWKITIEAPQVQRPNPYDEVETSANTGMGSLRQYLAYDFTDSTPPTSVDTMVNCPITRTAPFNKTMKMYIRPSLLKMSYEAGASTGYGYTPGKAWIDVDDSSVPHYGFKWILDNTEYDVTDTHEQAQMKWYVWYTVYYGFKNCQKPGLN